MAVGTWKIYAKAKHRIGTGTITLSSGLFKMSLHNTAASTNIIVLTTRDLFSGVGNEISARGGYAAGGRTILRGAASVIWTAGASTKHTAPPTGLNSCTTPGVSGRTGCSPVLPCRTTRGPGWAPPCRSTM